MLPISLATPLLDPNGPDVTAGQILARWHARAQRPGQMPFAYPEWVVREIADVIVVVTVEFGLRTSICAAQIEHETDNLAFTGQVRPDQYNFAGLGATNDGAAGASFPTILDGIRAVCAHHLAYIFGHVDNWPAHLRKYVTLDPRYAAVLSTGRAGTVKVLGDYTNGNWAYTSKYPVGSLANGYARSIAEIANAIHSYAREDLDMSRQVTDRYIAALRSRGREVIDMRGALKPKGAPYGQVPGGLAGVKHIAHHWTGDTFSREWYRVRLGDPNISDGPIPASLTVAQERKIIEFYDEIHKGQDWPGVAYGTLIFPSGRIYVIYDIGTLTYHAYNTNSVSYATCCPNANWAQPTIPQLISLNHVWDVLCNHTPEIPANHTMLYGHQEFGKAENKHLPGYDSRNQTSCPGTFLAHVQKFRATNRPTIDLPPAPPTKAPYGDPNAVYFPETKHWLVHGFRGFWEAHGGLAIFGYPISEEFDDARGIRVQYFERARMEWQPKIAKNPYGVVLGRVGAELADLDKLARSYPDAFAPQAGE